MNLPSARQENDSQHNDGAPLSGTKVATTPGEVQNGSGEMFDGIAKRYDLLNRLMSLGVDQGWRRQTVDALELASHPNVETPQILDVATGTADLALLIAEKVAASQVTGLDPSKGMLAVGEEKIAKKDLEERIKLIWGDAQRLPFADNSFDGITIAFGIRNVPDRNLALREMRRVCKPGGRVCILELTEPKEGLMAAISRFHMHTVAPAMGALLSGKKEYRYLPNSIAAFPAPDVFCDMMKDAGLEVVNCQKLKMGICYLYVGTPASQGE
jgi:demethylmenaquinone methyltransferase/2-methoxy-6-polyprenyl-1,4-benzoquinol methylase